MSQSNQPPGGAPPRVHHGAGTPPGQGTAPSGSIPDEQINPEDLKNSAVADYLAGRAPAEVTYVNDEPQAASKEKQADPPKVFPFEQAAREAADGVYTGLTKDPTSLWTAVKRVIGLGFLIDEINPRAIRVSLPFNSPQVVAGGFSVIRAVQTDRKAACMEVDVNALGQDLGKALRNDRAKQVLEWASRAADANETVVLTRIAGTVDKGLKLGESVINGDGNLSWVLRQALAIKGEPADAAVASRAQNARTEEEIRKDEQAKMQAGAPTEAPPQTTTTITTQAPPAQKGPGAPAPVPTGKSHHKPTVPRK